MGYILIFFLLLCKICIMFGKSPSTCIYIGKYLLLTFMESLFQLLATFLFLSLRIFSMSVNSIIWVWKSYYISNTGHGQCLSFKAFCINMHRKRELVLAVFFWPKTFHSWSVKRTSFFNMFENINNVYSSVFWWSKMVSVLPVVFIKYILYAKF